MLIGVEASALHGCKSGVGYYTENLLTSIMRVAPEHDYVLFSNRDMSDNWPPVQGPGVRGQGSGVGVRLKQGPDSWPLTPNCSVYNRRLFPVRAAWMQMVLPGTLREVQPDVCHFTNYLAPLASDCPYVVTIHDMTLFVT